MFNPVERQIKYFKHYLQSSLHAVLLRIDQIMFKHSREAGLNSIKRVGLYGATMAVQHTGVRGPAVVNLVE